MAMKDDKVVILLEEHEEIAIDSIELLKNQEYELCYPKNCKEILSDPKIKKASAILVRGMEVDSATIESMPDLKVIARCGVGTDNIDIEAATKHDVFVCNVPDANFVSVSEHVLGMMMALSHQIVNGDKAIRQGNFQARHQYVGVEMSEKTLGIIGFGRIGRMVAEKCIGSFQMNVIAYDPYVKSTEMRNVELVDSPSSIYKKADYITLHLPYTQELHHFIGENELKEMKNKAFLINCARGGLIDEVALANAVRNGEIAGAGIDVFEKEPPSKNSELWSEDNVIVTPHMGASTKEALIRMAVGAANEITRVLKGESPLNSLNSEMLNVNH